MGHRTLLGSRPKLLLHNGSALVVLADSLFGLIHDHDLGARFRHPDHFLDGAHLVGEEVDAADVKHAVEGLHA